MGHTDINNRTRLEVEWRLKERERELEKETLKE